MSVGAGRWPTRDGLVHRLIHSHLRLVDDGSLAGGDWWTSRLRRRAGEGSVTSCPKGLITPTPDMGAIPGLAVIETLSGRKAATDPGSAAVDDGRDSRHGCQRPTGRNGAVPSDVLILGRRCHTPRRPLAESPLNRH